MTAPPDPGTPRDPGALGDGVVEIDQSAILCLFQRGMGWFFDYYGAAFP